MVVRQLASDGDGNLLALTDDGSIFVLMNGAWQYVPGPTNDDLPQINGEVDAITS
jgi:hypothetical protein